MWFFFRIKCSSGIRNPHFINVKLIKTYRLLRLWQISLKRWTRAAPQVANYARRFVVAAETAEDDLSCSEKSRCPRSQTFSSASHGTSVLILLDLTWPLFVFLHRVIYLLVMRSKTLSGHSDNQPTFRVAENMPLPPSAGLCCVRRFCLISLSREIILEWMWKHRRTCDYFPCVRKK